jgi:hypothetical protein
MLFTSEQSIINKKIFKRYVTLADKQLQNNENKEEIR